MDRNAVISQTIMKEYTKKAVIDDVNLARMNGNGNSNKKSEMLKSSAFNFETDIIWSIALPIFLWHLIGIYGLLTFNYLEKPMTTLWMMAMYFVANIGVSGGAHRLWCHRSYKAKLPLKILYMMCFSVCAQNSICRWIRNHRMHHKYCDTNADPHNSLRGFMYCHVGWVIMKEHPEFIKKSKQLDLSDILSDPVVAFGEKYAVPLQVLFSFVLPSMVPVYLWNETWSRAIMSQMFIRYMVTSNSVWTINSIAHYWGTRPYNKSIKPANNDFVNIVTIGEGYHNFHHMFPWDYRSSEKGNNKFNYTTFFIDFCAKLGLAYDLKYPSADVIKNTILKTGDGTYSMSKLAKLESN